MYRCEECGRIVNDGAVLCSDCEMRYWRGEDMRSSPDVRRSLLNADVVRPRRLEGLNIQPAIPAEEQIDKRLKLGDE